MCSPHVIQNIVANLAANGGPDAGGRARPVPTMQQKRSPCSFSRVVDLTHTLPEQFPSALGDQWLRLEDVMTFEVDRINFKIWDIYEHIGTHIDAPIHFSEAGQAADEIPIENLVVPLAVIDLRARAAEDPDTQLTPDDIAEWVATNGDLPYGCCVAVNTGWR